MLNRRSFLRAAPAAGVALTVPAVALAETKPAMTPDERLAYHLAQFKKAAAEIDPRVRFSVQMIDFNSPHGPVVIMGQWANGFYNGDGVYKQNSKRCQNERYTVKLLDHPVQGERGFSVIPHHQPDRSKWMTLSETRLEAFIGEKVEGVLI